MAKNGALGANAAIRFHVEVHAAARMWLDGSKRATLRLNFRTCSWKFGCRQMLPLILPVGVVLTVVDSFGDRTEYTGVDYVQAEPDDPSVAVLQGRVQWDEEEAWSFDTVEEAERLLDAADKRVREAGRLIERPRWRLGRASRQPRMVVVEVAGRGALCVGLGGEESVLTLVNDDGMPPYYTSFANSSRTGRVWFDFMGEGSEFGEEELVPIELARSAVNHWMETGDLAVVGWHET